MEEGWKKGANGRMAGPKLHSRLVELGRRGQLHSCLAELGGRGVQTKEW